MNIIKTIKTIGDYSKFSWAEACSDINGKTSMTVIVGAYLSCLGATMSAIEALMNHIEEVPYFITLATLGAGIVLGRKIVNGKPSVEDTVVENSKELVSEQ